VTSSFAHQTTLSTHEVVASQFERGLPSGSSLPASTFLSADDHATSISARRSTDFQPDRLDASQQRAGLFAAQMVNDLCHRREERAFNVGRRDTLV